MSSSRDGKGAALSPGTRLGPYEVAGQIGAGGMGEVYRATDTRLKRDVAIKVLPEAFTESAERLARFGREAQLLAQLHHPHIASIFGLEEADGVQALVMELVEGPTLGERMAQGPFSIDEALSIARQIAEALEVAHEKGIVHRDLKPANVKLTPEGNVKVLDFGLAKALQPAADSADSPSVSLSPTLTLGATVQGVILGTAAYMAPEQAAGKGVDRRADIWAFGVVLYEMLTGQRLFGGETVSHVLASVLKDEPDFSALPAETPERIANLVRRCLRKKPRERLQAIGDARVVIEEVLARPDAERSLALAAPPPPSRLPWAIAGMSLLAALALAVLALRTPSAEDAGRMVHASLAAPAETWLGETFALSPDGRRLAFQAFDKSTGIAALWMRDLGSPEARRIEGAERGEMPFWSPDGRQLGFFANGRMKRIDSAGGAAQFIAEAPTPRGASWGEGGWIVFAPSFRVGLSRVRASGGEVEPLTELDDSRGEKSHRFPVFLPGGESLLFQAQTAEGGAIDDSSTLEALSLVTGKRTTLLHANSSPIYSATGHLLFWRAGSLQAQAFDAARLTLAGEPLSLAAGVAYSRNEQVLASVSAEGTLVFQKGESGGFSEIFGIDRRGIETKLIQELRPHGVTLVLSHDGSRLLIESSAPGQGASDLWVHDLKRGTESRLTFHPAGDAYGTWSPDDRWVYYSNDEHNDGAIFRRRSDGSGNPERLGTTEAGLWPLDASQGGEWLVAGTMSGDTYFDLLRFDLATGESEPLIATPFLEDQGALSPDDRLLAYLSEEPGRPEVFVSSLGEAGGRWQISTDGGSSPRWRADGRELFYLAPPDRIMVVEVEPGEVPRFSVPRLLFRSAIQDFDVAADGESFVAARLTNRGSGDAFRLVTHWPQLLLPRRP